MDASDTVNSVSSGPEVLRAASNVQVQAPVAPSEEKIKSSEQSAQTTDAVKVDVSTATDELRAAEKQSASDSQVVRDTIEHQAAQLESTLNSKVVRFRVAVKEGDKAEMHFQVVDRETGKIVREFPPEKAHDFKDIAGLMLDKKV